MLEWIWAVILLVVTLLLFILEIRRVEDTDGSGVGYFFGVLTSVGALASVQDDIFWPALKWLGHVVPESGTLLHVVSVGCIILVSFALYFGALVSAAAGVVWLARRSRTSVAPSV